MKRLLSFILSLVISIHECADACGPYYPYGDDVRFCAFDPGNFSYKNFASFYYSARLFSETTDIGGDDPNAGEQMNVDLWKKRCKNQPVEKDIYEAVHLSADSLYSMKGNSFADFLIKNKDLEAIRYLDFAKKANKYNIMLSDPWERNDEVNIPQRITMAQEALSMCRQVKDNDIQLRYAFIAMRLAWYATNSSLVRSVYNQYFSERKARNIIDYWALYFKVMVEPYSACNNYCAALVFSNAPDKRFAVSFRYDKTIPVSQSLRYARNRKEEAAVWLLHGIKNPARAMESIQQLYRLDPHSEGLGLLLLREINKLEDWIYTPYYTNYAPSILEETTRKKMENRITKDKLYAKTVLDLTSNMDLSKVDQPVFIKMATAYLQAMTNDYASSLQTIKRIRTKYRLTEKEKRQLDIMNALSLNAQQPYGHAIIPGQVKPVLIREINASNYKFIFAIARELEFKGNTTDAAFLLSKMRHENSWENGVYWKLKKKNITMWADYYDDYFFYIDEQYTPQQVKEMISVLETKKSTDSFDIWKTGTCREELPRLYDLLGTKYLRLNDLSNALAAFEKVNDSFWRSDDYYYKDYLDANPFYTNFINEHAKTDADSIYFTKTSIVKTLIQYLQKAADVHNKDRDYYYFLAANCYLNMTQYGNSWMMKRYYWTYQMQETIMPDNNEYFSCGYAKYYYLKARQVSRSKKFSALCLRMAGRCEKYNNRYHHEDWDYEKLFASNKYYRQIRDQYPDDFFELMDNCESFEKYLRTRKRMTGL